MEVQRDLVSRSEFSVRTSVLEPHGDSGLRGQAAGHLHRGPGEAGGRAGTGMAERPVPPTSESSPLGGSSPTLLDH